MASAALATAQQEIEAGEDRDAEQEQAGLVEETLVAVMSIMTLPQDPREMFVPVIARRSFAREPSADKLSRCGTQDEPQRDHHS